MEDFGEGGVTRVALRGVAMGGDYDGRSVARGRFIILAALREGYLRRSPISADKDSSRSLHVAAKFTKVSSSTRTNKSSIHAE
jgi:hypothetical protein